MSNEVHRTAHKANDNPLVEWGARVGYAANGLLHILLGWLAAQVALGGGGKNADQSGALALVAKESWGQALLWVIFAGFALLALWQISEVFTQREGSEKAKAGGKAAAYAALAYTSIQFALGGGSSSSKQTKDFTTTLLKSSGGQIIVGIIALVILGVAVYHVYKGWKKKFLEDLEEHPGTWAVHAGRIGYIAKGVALGTVGVLFGYAALQDKAARANGLDGALHALRDLPFGKFLLLVIALGLAAYGIYSFARARYARL